MMLFSIVAFPFNFYVSAFYNFLDISTIRSPDFFRIDFPANSTNHSLIHAIRTTRYDLQDTLHASRTTRLRRNCYATNRRYFKKSSPSLFLVSSLCMFLSISHSKDHFLLIFANFCSFLPTFSLVLLCT